jgi:putative addiction module component (TIGR02574 family)
MSTSTDLEQLTAQVLALPEASRAQLITALIDSLPHPPDDHSEVWRAEEAERRCQEIADGSVECIPGEEVFRRAREHLRSIHSPVSTELPRRVGNADEEGAIGGTATV